MKLALIIALFGSLSFSTAGPQTAGSPADTKKSEICMDSYDNCKKYVDNNQCWDKKFRNWMRRRCRKTCDFCAPDCYLPLGDQIDRFSTLSMYSFETYPTKENVKLESAGGYRAAHADSLSSKFVGVTFKKEMIITGVTTKGFGDSKEPMWVKKYILKFVRKEGGEEEFMLNSNGLPKKFEGNNDSDTPVPHNFTAVNVRQVYIQPQDFHNNVAFRFEIFGCTMKRSVVLWLRLTDEKCTLEMLLDKQSDGFEDIDKSLQTEQDKISNLPGVQVIQLEHLRPGSLIVEFKVGVEDSQLHQMIRGVKKMIMTSSKFHHSFLGVKDLQGTSFCKTPNISFANLSQIPEAAVEIKRSSFFQMKAFLQSHIQLKTKVTWKIAYLRNSHKSVLNSKSVFESTHVIQQEEIDVKNKTTVVWDIVSNTLHYGVYYIEVMVEANNSNNCANYNYGFLRIKPSPLQATISAEPSVKSLFQGYNKELTLDASSSFDPDAPNADHSTFNYTWLCARKNERFNHILTLPVVSQDDIKDSNNRGCYGTGPGKLKFTGSTATLFLDKMAAENVYVITMILERGRRKTNISYEFELKNINKLGVEIRCKRNCKRKIDTKVKMVFEALCVGEVCKQTTPQLTWSLYRKRDDSIVTIKSSKNDKFLEIGRNILDEGEVYELQLHGYFNSDDITNSSQTYPVITNESPSGGDCTVDKKEGVVLTTNFTFECFGWRDKDTDLTYQFGYKSDNGAYEIIQEGRQSFLRTNKLPQGDSEKDHEVQVDIYVKDQWGGYGMKSVTVKVLATETINVSALYQYTVGNQSEMARLLNSKDGGKSAMRLANTLLSVMSATSDNELKTEDKIKFKDEMIRHSSKVKVDDLQGLILVTSVVASATDERSELSEESQWKSVDVLENMADKFENITSINEEDTAGITKAGNNLLLGIGNVLGAVSMREEKEEEKTVQDKEERIAKSKVNATKTKELAKKAWNLIGKVGDSMLSSREVGDEPLEMETKAISMVLNRQLPSDISNKPSKINDSQVIFPPPEELLGADAMGMAHVDTQMISLNQNPFSWDQSSKNVKSAVISIDLKNDKGKLLNVSGLSKEIELNIRTNRQQQYQTPLQAFVKPSIKGSMQYHRVTISTQGFVMSLDIVPQNGTTMQIYVRHSKRPTVDSYDYVTEVPDFTSCKKRADNRRHAASNAALHEGYLNCTRDPHLVIIPNNVTEKLGMLYIGVQLSGSDSVKHQRKRRSCSGSGRQKRSEICVEFKDPPTTPPPTPRISVPTYDPGTDVNYTLSVAMATCLYWSESREKWTSEGCRVGPNSVNGSLQCLCTHLSAFGGDFLVAPNPIDFDKVWDAFSNILETKNFLVLGTVCVMLGLYIIAVVFARRADRSDCQKVTQVIPLGDVNTENHCYELTVYTGLWRRCGTSANVAIMIYGDDRDTDIIPLNCNTMCNNKLFARGSVNTFMLSLKESLGDISHIKLWHDNTGDNPQWYVNKVVIRDPTTDTSWFFVCNRWLAAEREDGKIERVLYVSSPEEVNSFRNKFCSRASAGLGDGHIWLSVIARPPTSPFTRVQRLSCCLSILMSAMVTNAMFYQFGAEETSNAFQIGPLVLSWRQFIIGVQSAVLVVPINVLIVFIFRNIRPKHDVTHSYDTNCDNPRPATGKSGFKLPRFFLYLGWTLCILTSLTSATFTVFYSMMWGTEVSNKWLTSILVSFTQDVLFIQPIKVIIVASLLALIIKKAPEDDSLKEHQKSVAYSKVKGESHEPQRPDKQELEQFRKYRKRVMTMARVAIELFFYLTFAWALMVICYGRRDTGHYWMTNGIDELLPRFDKVRDAGSFWEWTKAYFVPAMYNITWYNGKPFEYKDGFISDLSGYMVGMPRFRQLRVKTGPCPIAPRYAEFRETLHPCLPPYGFSDEDTTPYSMPKWQEIPANKTAFLTKFAIRQMCPRPWRYKNADELHNLPFQGLRGVYGGGGYVADLGYTKGSALRVIHNLQNNSWIDEKTRAVFIEFMIFDSSTNLFSAMTLLLEILPLGGVVTFKRINTMSLYGARTAGSRTINALCELIVIIVVCYFIVAEIIKLYKQKCSYFKSAWSYVELAQILSATATIILSIFRRYHTSKLVKKIHANPFETSSFHYAVMWSDLENAFIAVLVFILTVKVLKILKFNEHIASLAASMARCKDKIISYSAVFMVTFLAFMQIALLVFGNTTKAYSSVSEVFRTQFGMFIGGATNYHELKDANRIIGPIYFFLFMTAMACILINMFLAILNESYRDVRIYPDERDNEERKMLGVFLHYAKTKFGRKLSAMKNTKCFPQTNGYDIKHTPIDCDRRTEEKYTPLNWGACDFICQKHFENTEGNVESSFLKDIRNCLKSIRSELKQTSLLPRSRKYEVYEIQQRFEARDTPDENLKIPCMGLGLEKISSKCSLFSLSDSTMYLANRRGSDMKRLLYKEDSSEEEDWDSDSATSYTDDAMSYAESVCTIFGKHNIVYSPDRETCL